MAAPGTAPLQVTLDPASNSGAAGTHALLAAMLRATEKVSDLIFSPGRPPQVEVYGQLIPVQGPGLRLLSADDTRRIASDLIGDNKQAINMLREQGSCDISFGLARTGPFSGQRFHPARQLRGGDARDSNHDSGVLHPGLAAATGGNRQSPGWHCPGHGSARGGKVLHAGGAAGPHQRKTDLPHSSPSKIPIEFLHNHKQSTIHQRELHSDTPNFALALRAALRQAPKVILVGELRDRETMEMVLEAAETGHLVLSSLNAPNAAKTLERIANAFPPAEQSSLRGRLAKTLRYVISQHLIPRKDGGRVAILEVFKNTQRTAQLPRVRRSFRRHSA